MVSQKELMKEYSKYILPYVKDEIFLFFLMIFSSLGSLVTPYVLKVVIDEVFPSGNYRQLVNYLILLVIIYIFQIIFSLISDVISTKLSKKISSDIREDAFANILTKHISFFNNSKIGELVFTLINDVDNIQQTISSLLVKSLKNFIVLVGVVIMLFVLNFKLALMSLMFLPAIVFVIRFFTPYIKDNFLKIQEKEADLNNFLVERFKNIRVIKNYNTYVIENNKIEDKHKELVNSHGRGTLISSLNGSISSFVMSLAPILVLAYGGSQVFNNAMSIGGVIAFIQYLNRLFTPTIEIVSSYNQFSKSKVSMNRLYEYINKPIRKDQKKVLNKVIIKKIEFKDVCMQFGNLEILKDLNIIFEEGKTYVISGESGSGKSSIINLLAGYVNPTSGQIFINNKKIDFNGYWSNEFCLIEKENQLFHDTIKNNINYGSESGILHNDEIIKYSILEEVLANLEKGSSTIISSNGGSLSDGQKQRISIARAIRKMPSVFIFDESTMSLDPKLERNIISNIRLLFPNCIIIIISHRIETLDLADSVLNLENGVITKNSLPKAI